jgi:hypothetical protein
LEDSQIEVHINYVALLTELYSQGTLIFLRLESAFFCFELNLFSLQERQRFLTLLFLFLSSLRCSTCVYRLHRRKKLIEFIPPY